MPIASLLVYIMAKHSYFAPNKESCERKHARNASFPLIYNIKQHDNDPTTRYIRPKFARNEAKVLAFN